VLFPHQSGWQLRLEVGDEPFRTQVCRSTEEVLSADEAWKAVTIGKGWTENAGSPATR
jgi:hypothetical protein